MLAKTTVHHVLGAPKLTTYSVACGRCGRVTKRRRDLGRAVDEHNRHRCPNREVT